MDTITLIFSRRVGITGMAIPIRVRVNDNEIGKIKVGGRLETSIPVKDCVVDLEMVGSSASFHPIKASFTLRAANCTKGVITVDFGVKANPLGLLTSGIWAKMGDIRADIKYL